MIMLLLSLFSGAWAQEVDGFAELRLQAYADVQADLAVFAVERFRPKFTVPLADRVIFSTTIEAGLGHGWSTQAAFADLVEREGLSPTLTLALGDEPANDVFGISTVHDYLSVDRLYVELQLKAADIRIGRQALNWGSGFIVNPSDPFPEILLTQPWKPRSGINAARLDVPFGGLNSLQIIAGSDDAFVHPRLAGRLTVNWLEADWSLVGAWREEIDEGIVGIDIKGTLGVGFWFEGVLHITGETDPYEEFAVGIDYSFPVGESLIVTAQYYRNGSGSTTTTAPTLFQRPKAFAPAFGGRDYLMASVGVGLNQEISLATLWMQNLNDGSAFMVPTMTVIVTDQFDVSLAGQIPISASENGGEFKPAPHNLRVELPTEDGSMKPVDLSGLVPNATFILWSRFNF